MARPYFTIGALATALAALHPTEAEGQWPIGTRRAGARAVETSVLCDAAAHDELVARRALPRILDRSVPLTIDSTCAAAYDAARPRAVRSGTNAYAGHPQLDSVAARIDFPRASVNFARGDSIFIRPTPTVIGSVYCPPSIEGAAADGMLTPEELQPIRYGTPCTLFVTSEANGKRILYAVNPNRVLDHVASQRNWWNTYVPHRQP